jgi:release factor glutamine methyltransferase
MNIDHLIKEGSRILREQNIFSYQIDSELLLSKIIKKDRVFILTNGNYVVSSKEIDDYLNIISRRQKHEPLAYITKKKEFWSLDLEVDNNVLIPRPETEIIVEQVVKKFKSNNGLNILDIGTGSGCILLSILKELTKSYGIGIDRSFRTLGIARKNSKKLNLLNRTKFIHCDIDNFNFGNYDVIVSNPPYICSYGIRHLSKDVKNFEPRLALDGGRSGLEIINKVIIKAKKLLKAKGCLYMEIGYKQLPGVSDMLVKNGFRLVRKFFDYTKTIRCIMSTKAI